MRPLNSFIGAASTLMLPRPNSRSLNFVERSGSLRKLRYVQVPSRMLLIASALMLTLLKLNIRIVAFDLNKVRVVISTRVKNEAQLFPGADHLEIAGIVVGNTLRPGHLRTIGIEYLHRPV